MTKDNLAELTQFLLDLDTALPAQDPYHYPHRLQVGRVIGGDYDVMVFIHYNGHEEAFCLSNLFAVYDEAMGPVLSLSQFAGGKGISCSSTR